MLFCSSSLICLSPARNAHNTQRYNTDPPRVHERRRVRVAHGRQVAPRELQLRVAAEQQGFRYVLGLSKRGGRLSDTPGTTALVLITSCLYSTASELGLSPPPPPAARRPPFFLSSFFVLKTLFSRLPVKNTIFYLFVFSFFHVLLPFFFLPAFCFHELLPYLKKKKCTWL